MDLDLHAAERHQRSPDKEPKRQPPRLPVAKLVQQRKVQSDWEGPESLALLVHCNRGSVDINPDLGGGPDLSALLEQRVCKFVLTLIVYIS